MAKVGEGEARWLVQDRADGKNVGNWHWTEKSLFPWAKDQMEQTFADYNILEDATKKVWLAGVDSFKGEIFVTNRKGKTRFIYDVNMNLRWKATLKGEEAPIHEAGGRVECTDINVTDDDFDVKYTIDLGDNGQGRELMAVVKQHVVAIVKKEWKAMMALMSQLHSNASKVGVESSGSGSPSLSTSSPTASTPAPAATGGSNATSSSSTSTSAPITTTVTTSNGAQLKVKTISQVVKFQTQSSSIFETLLDAGRVSAFTGSVAQISSDKGSAFSLFGGSVLGVTEDVVPGKMIAQKWRFASWPADHYSQVTIEIEDKGTKCLVRLTQTGVPDSDFDRTRVGWEEHFWRRIKGVFGWDYTVKAPK
jgi:activator of HSP90 ATPase